MAAPAAAQDTPDSIQSFIELQQELNHIPGIAVAVVQDGKVEEYVSGTADLEWNAPVTRDTRFQLASVTKLFTGVLVMRLVEAGKLDLDSPISRYLPAAPAAWQPITVRMLANHTSGIPEAPEEFTPTTLAEVFDWAKDKPLDWAPGSQARYGRNDFSILAMAIDAATGQTFEDALRTNLLEPAGLTSTGYSHLNQQGWVRTAVPLERRATVYHWDEGQRSYEFLYPEPTYPAGGLFSTLADVELLLSGLQQGKLLRPEHLAELTTPATLSDGSRGPFGIGWVAHTHHGVPVAGHTGGPALADVTYYPDRHLAVVVLQNQHRLYPWLSGAIVDKVIGVPEIEAIADADPAATKAALDAMQATFSGSPRPDSWSETAKSDFLPWFETDGRSLLRAMGEPKSSILVAEKSGPDGRERTYSVTFANATARWTAVTNASGKLEAIVPTDE
ncbi:serine hydrolase [Altererythrobacter salegens]|uniref:Serine hydrolase n=1 Tax=Croceibacterium salegens TaxID=1737568 RepID=A0A6I4SVI8_9SPHN|nr:serine hydrolase domain-containing protein [Croceibacterium salegens]MXO59369.1 serine hydrolase [Croceibacterium salegens]